QTPFRRASSHRFVVCSKCSDPWTGRPDEWISSLTAQETADRIRVKRKTLYTWAGTWDVEHRGPEPHRMGGRALRYRESDVDRYIDHRKTAAIAYQRSQRAAVEEGRDPLPHRGRRNRGIPTI